MSPLSGGSSGTQSTYSAQRWLDDEVRSGAVAWVRHERTPWEYHRNDPRHARDWPYRLVQFRGGFRMRVYDWELGQ